MAIDVEMASGGAAAGKVQPVDAGNVSGSGGARELQVVEAGQEDTIKLKAPTAPPVCFLLLACFNFVLFCIKCVRLCQSAV